MSTMRNRRGGDSPTGASPALDWAVNHARAQDAILRQSELVQEIEFHCADAQLQIRKIKDAFAAVTELRRWPRGGRSRPHDGSGAEG